MASTLSTSEATRLAPATRGLKDRGKKRPGPYPYWFYALPAIIYMVFFIVPTLASFYFSFTRWDLFTSTWIGLNNYRTFFPEQALIIGLRNTLIYAVITSGMKVVLGMALALLLTSQDHRSRLSAVGDLLPGAGQHHRRRSHLHRLDEPGEGSDQPGVGRGGH